MALSLGELILQLGLDSTRYRSQLNQAKLDALKTGAEIEKILGGTSVNSRPIDGLTTRANTSEKKWAEAKTRLKQPLVTAVDDRQLTKLNQHIDLKIDHWDEAVRRIGGKPIRPNFDGSGFAAAAAETDTAVDRQKRAQESFNGTSMRPVIEPLHNEGLRKDLETQQRELDQSVAYFEQNPIVFRVNTSELDAATERLKNFQEDYESTVSRINASPINASPVNATSIPESNVRYDPKLRRYRYADGPDKGKFAPHPNAAPRSDVNVNVGQRGYSVGDKAKDVVLDHILEKTLGSAVDLALEEGFTRVLGLTSKILKEQFGGIQHLGIGKVLSKEIDQLKDRTQRKYAPEKGVTGRVETAKRKIERDVIQAPAKLITAPIRGVMKGFYEGIGGVYGSRFGTGSADRLEKGMGRSISDVGAESGRFANKLSGLDAVNAIIDKIGKLGELETAVKPVLKKYGINLDGDSVEDKVTDGALQYAKRIANILDNSLDETKIQSDIDAAKNAFIELGKAIAVTNDQASKAQSLKDLAASAQSLASHPRNAVIDTYKAGAKVSAEKLEERLESPATPAEKLEEGIRRVAFVSAGFSASEGKQSHNMAAEVAKYAGEGVKIVPFENREFEVTKDAATDGAPAWVLDVLNTVSGTIEKGYNPAAVRMAAEAAQYKQQNPDVDIDLVGHSAGGLIAKEAQAILRELGIDSRVLAMATPNVGAFQSNTDKSAGLMGMGDPMRFISDVSSLSEVGVAGHEFPEYAKNADVQNRIKEFLNAPNRSGGREDSSYQYDEPIGPDPTPPSGSAAATPSQSASARKRDRAMTVLVDQVFTVLNQPAPSETKQKVRDAYKRAAEEIKALVDAGESEYSAVETKTGFRTSEASKGQKYSLDGSELPRVETALSHKQAEQITLFVGGFGGVNGLESEYLGQEVSKNLPKHHVVGVESPEFDVKPEAGQTVAHPAFLKKAYDTIVAQASDDGENETARRMAERAYVYHKENPDMPINLIGQSGGSMVARAAAQILHEMQVPNVRVVATAAPHFGASEQNGMTLASQMDPFRSIAGPIMTNMVPVDSVPAHSKYYNTAGAGGSRERVMQVQSGETEIQPNHQVQSALNAFFDRTVDEATALENARQAAAQARPSSAQKNQAESAEQIEMFPVEKKHPLQTKGDQLRVALEKAIDPEPIRQGVESVGVSLRSLIESIVSLDAAAQSDSVKNLADSIQSFGKPRPETPEPPTFTTAANGQMELLTTQRQYADVQLDLLDSSMRPLPNLTPKATTHTDARQMTLFNDKLEPRKFKDGQDAMSRAVRSAEKTAATSIEQFSGIASNLQEGLAPIAELIQVSGDQLDQVKSVLQPAADMVEAARQGIQSKAADLIESGKAASPVVGATIRDRAIADTQIVIEKTKQVFQRKPKIEAPLQIVKTPDPVSVKPLPKFAEIPDFWAIEESAAEVVEQVASVGEVIKREIESLNGSLAEAQKSIESTDMPDVSVDSSFTKKSFTKIAQPPKTEKVSIETAQPLDVNALQQHLQSKAVSREELLKIAKAAGIKGVSKSNKAALAEKIVAVNPELAAQMVQERKIIAELLATEKAFGRLIDAAGKLKGDDKTEGLEDLRRQAIEIIAKMDAENSLIETGSHRSEYGGVKGRIEQRLKTRLAITPEMIENRKSTPVPTQDAVSSAIDNISGLARISSDQKKGFFEKVKGFFQRGIDDAAQGAIDAIDGINESAADQAFGAYAAVKSGEVSEALRNVAEDAREAAVQIALDQINNIDAPTADAGRAVYAASKDGRVASELLNQGKKGVEYGVSQAKESVGQHFQRSTSPNMEGTANYSVGGFRFVVNDEINQKVVQGRKRVEQAVEVHGIWKRTFTKNLEKNYVEFARQVAASSNIEMKPEDMPTLEVNDRLLKKMGVGAFYDIKKNRVIVSKEIAKALDRDASQLEKYEETLEAVTHELRHAAQFDFGRKKISQISSGRTGFGVAITPESQVSADQVGKAEASVNAAQRQAQKRNRYTFSAAEKSTLKAAEIDAYAFEKNTGNILKNVSGNLKSRSRQDFAVIQGYAKQAATIMVSHFAQRFPGLAGIIDGMVTKFKGIPLAILQGFASFKVLEWVLQKIPQIAGASVEAAQRFERLGLKMAFASGSAASAQRNFALIRDEAKRLGTDLEASASGFVAITTAAKGGALEGAGAESIFKSLNQASSVYQLDPETQGRAFTATQQMISKGSAVSSEELKQQLGEALPGTIQIAARAAGKSTAEFTKMLESGQVLVDDFLPKFANQLSAETSTGVAGAADTAQASLNRLNSTMTDLKVSLGTPLLEVQKQAFKAFNAVLVSLMPILPALTIGLGAGLARASFMGAAAVFNFATGLSLSAVVGRAFAALLGVLPGLLANIGMQILRAIPMLLAFQAAMDVIGAVGKVFKNAGQEARDAADQIGEFNKKYNEMKGITSEKSGNPIENVMNDIKSGRGLTGLGINSKQDSALGDTMIGKTADFVFGKGATTTAEQFIQKSQGLAAKYNGAQFLADKVFGEGNVKFGSTYAEKKHNDLMTENRNFEFAAGETRGKAYGMFDPITKKPIGSLRETVDIDARLQELNAKRRTIRPGQDDEKRDLDRQIEELRTQRESSSKEISAVQGQLAAQIQARTNLIKGMKEYRDSGQVTGAELVSVNDQIKQMELNLEADQSALNKFNKILGHSADEARRLKESIEDIDFDAQSGQKALGFRQAQAKTQLAKELIGATAGTKEESLRKLELRQLSERSALNQQLIDRYKDMLQSAEAQRTLSIAGLGNGTIEELQGAEIKKIASRMTDGQEKTNLEQMADAVDKLRDLETETVGMGQQVADSQSQAAEKLRDNTKSVQEFFRQIQRSAEESALAARDTKNQISTINAKAKIKKALTGFQDNYVSEWADGLVGLIEQFNEPFKIALEAQKQILAKKNSLEDLLRQQSEQAKQMPTAYEGMGAGGVGVPNGAPIATALIQNSALKLADSNDGHNIRDFSDITRHHVNRGRESGRSYANVGVGGREEEVSSSGLLKKDFVALGPNDNMVNLPSPTAGYAEAVGDAFNTLLIFADKERTKLKAKILHLDTVAVKTGDQVQYGQNIGVQGGRGINQNGQADRFAYGTHAHMELPDVASWTRYVKDLQTGTFRGISSATEERHTEGDGHNHGASPRPTAYQGGQKHVVIPLDHTRENVADKTGGSTYKAAGQRGASYGGYTERDFQDPLVAQLQKQLTAQGIKVTVLRPEDFKSYEDYDAKLQKLAAQAGTIVTPTHFDAVMPGYKGGYLTRGKAGDAGDAQLGNAIYSNMTSRVRGKTVSTIAAQDTQDNMTINKAGAAPATLVEFGGMADLIKAGIKPQNYSQSQDGKAAIAGYLAGVSQYFGKAGGPAQSAQSGGGQFVTAQTMEQKIAAGLAIAIPQVKSRETFRPNAYDDGTGVQTIGYGETTPSIVNRGSITESEASQIMQVRIEKDFLRPVLAMIPKQAQQELTPGQIAAIASFTYNTGTDGFRKSDFGKTLMRGDIAGAGKVLPESYINPGSNVQEGLRNRRKEELVMYKSTAPAPGVMMPSTGITQADVEMQESYGKEYAALQQQLNGAGLLATDTTNQEIEGIKRLAAAQGMLAEVENKMALKRSEYQLEQGGRDQEKATRGISQQMQDMKMQLGEDTPYKALRNNLIQADREYKQFGESVFENSQKINHALAEALNMRDLIQTGQLPEQFNQFLPELSKQIASLQKQKTAMDSLAGNVNKTYGARVKDIKDKFAVEDKGRRFDFGQQLSAQQIQVQRSNITRLQGEAESTKLQDPKKKAEIQVEVASLTAQASSSEIKNRLGQQKFELDAKVRTGNILPEEAKKLREVYEGIAKIDLSNVSKELDLQLTQIENLDSARVFEIHKDFLSANIEQLRAEAQDIQNRSQKSGTGALQRLDLQEQSAKLTYQADVDQASLDRFSYDTGLDEQLKKSEKSKEEVAKLRAEYEKTAKVKLDGLTSQLANQLETLKLQREELLFQQKTKIFESDQQLGQGRSGQLRYNGNGLQAIELDSSLGLDKLKFDFETQIRGLDRAVASGEILAETADKIRLNLTELNGIQLTELNNQLAKAKDDFKFDNDSQIFNSRMSLSSAKAGYARTYGMEAPAREFEKDAAIAQAGFDLTSKTREIDEMVRSGRMATETAAELKANLNALNEVNLQTIQAQFNPLTEAVKAVKGSFQGFLGDVISGNETIGDAFDKMVDGVLQSLSAMAAQLITEQLFGAIFGLGKKKGGGAEGDGAGGGIGGGIGGIISGLFGFADGGVVTAAPGQGDARHRNDSIGYALRQEGPDSVLATLTPGEKVLTVEQRLRYEGMGLDKLVEHPAPRAMNQVLRYHATSRDRYANATTARASIDQSQRSERFGRVLGFSAGGTVPGAAIRVPSVSNIAGGGGTNISVPININGGGNPPAINIPRMQDAMRVAAQKEIRAAQRPHGQLF